MGKDDDGLSLFERVVLGKRIETTGESDMSKRIENRNKKAAAAQKKHDAELKALAKEARLKAKQAEIESYFGGSGSHQDANAGLFGFMQRIFGPRITGGGITGDDPKEMIIDAQATDVDGVKSTRLDPEVLRGWFRRSRPVVGDASINALNLDKNQHIKQRLPPNKP